MDNSVKRLKIFLISAGAVLADQISKAVVVKKIPLFFGKVNVLGDLVTFIHVRNKAAGFSIGSSLTGFMRIMFIFVIPALLMGLLSYVLYNSDRYKMKTRIEKTALALIIGGGTGNLIDRIFRKEGVVDFINVRVFGLFGYEYWPTFNIADSCVVVGVLLMLVYAVIGAVKEKKGANSRP